jgi:SAM-dependent methyltransferase
MGSKPANWTYPALDAEDAFDPATRAYLASRDVAAQYDRYFSGSPLFRFDTALLTHWLPRPGAMLDFGCGTGRHMAHFLARGWRVTGVDLSEHMLAEAARKTAAFGGRGRLVRANLCDLPAELLAGGFDAAVCMFSTLGMIRPAAARRAFCRDAAAALRPGGLLAVHVHNRSHNWLSREGWAGLVGSFFAALARRRQWGDKRLGNYRGIRGMVVHVFTRRGIRKLLEGAGLTIEHIVPLNERREGPLVGRWMVGLRANGYILLARKPDQPFSQHHHAGAA